MTCEPPPGRFHFFNFFERTDKVDQLLEMWQNAAQYMRNVDHFISTFLHESTDPNSVYPFVNFAVNDSDDVCCYGKPDEQWKALTFDRIKGVFAAYSAGYREIASYSGSELQSDDKDRSSDHRFFVTSLKVKDDVSADDLEANWKSWSGCDVIHEQLKGDSRLVESHLYKFVDPRHVHDVIIKIGFDSNDDVMLKSRAALAVYVYIFSSPFTRKRFTTKLSPVFNYVVRTELTGLDDETGRKIAKTANERTAKQSGVETEIGFYNVRVTHLHA